jgi:hypothetical protein
VFERGGHAAQTQDVKLVKQGLLKQGRDPHW